MMDYPRRPKYFAQAFIRLLTKTAAAQELGPSVCWMLSIVVTQEDAKRYTEPAKWYYEQLMPLCGFKSPKQLRSAIEKAVELGWLYYEHGAKSKPGKFFVLIPDEFKELTPGGCDESGEFTSDSEAETEMNRATKKECTSESEAEAEVNRATMRKCKGNASIPSPIPSPISLSGFDRWWEVYVLKKAKGDAEKAYRKAVEVIAKREGKTNDEAEAWLLAQTKARMPGLAKSEAQYRPYPATWLNGQRFYDQLECSPKDDEHWETITTPSKEPALC